MKIGDEVYAVESQYAFVRHGFIISEEVQLDGESDKVIKEYLVSYNDRPSYYYYSESGWHKEEELFKERAQAIAYSEYLRREV